MLQLLKIVIIIALPVFFNFVTSGISVLRSKRGSERNDWMTESVSTESDEGMTPSTISTGDFVFVGDMVFEKKSVADESSEEEGVQKSVIRNMSRIWPNKQMPIRFHSSVGRRARRAVQTAINTLEGETCISFPKYDPYLHKNYMTIKSTEEGCKTFVGFKENQDHNQINLASGDPFCESSPSAIHEIMHSLGVYHEQNRYDRDEYIEVLFHNLMPDTVSQYYKQSRADLETYGEPYDYGSIMHYEVRAGTMYGLPGFRVLRSYNEDAIGHAKVPSRIDLRKLNKLYGCPASYGSDEVISF
uniref:Metalloendopeptidase n=2 Tax=Meloidogyne enterolobii TaxID=390850 RepID=A0A6V7U1B0_MELEN|nr:unnamed protein product [Meloidogyne enterolobii]